MSAQQGQAQPGFSTRTGTPSAMRRVGGWNSAGLPVPTPATRIAESNVNVMTRPSRVRRDGSSDRSLTKSFGAENRLHLHKIMLSYTNNACYGRGGLRGSQFGGDRLISPKRQRVNPRLDWE